jgi:ubiquinone/menaquinone biosynthesis C-methylase UbiE
MASSEITGALVKEYDEMYRKNDFVHFKQDRIYIRKLCSFLADPGQSSVLDVGCGRGYWTRLFQEGGIGRVVGIDISQIGLEAARREVPGAEFIEADARHLQFADKSFDVIFCQGLSDFNTPDLSGAEAGPELYRCLKEGGLFIFATTSNLSGKKRITWMQHKPEDVRIYLRTLGYQIEATYFIDRVIFLRLFGKYVFHSFFSKYTIPAICRLTGLRGQLICIGRKRTC